MWEGRSHSAVAFTVGSLAYLSAQYSDHTNTGWLHANSYKKHSLQMSEPECLTAEKMTTGVWQEVRQD